LELERRLRDLYEEWRDLKEALPKAERVVARLSPNKVHLTTTLSWPKGFALNWVQ